MTLRASGDAFSIADINISWRTGSTGSEGKPQEPVRTGRARPIFSVRVIVAVAPDLATLAAQLRSADTNLRGVAAAERLLIDGTSSLYGQDENLLSEELHRIHYLLQG